MIRYPIILTIWDTKALQMNELDKLTTHSSPQTHNGYLDGFQKGYRWRVSRH